jgi:hypothetical protein
LARFPCVGSLRGVPAWGPCVGSLWGPCVGVLVPVWGFWFPGGVLWVGASLAFGSRGAGGPWRGRVRIWDTRRVLARRLMSLADGVAVRVSRWRIGAIGKGAWLCAERTTKRGTLVIVGLFGYRAEQNW